MTDRRGLPTDADEVPAFESMYGTDTALFTRREVDAGLGALGLLGVVASIRGSIGFIANALRNSGDTTTDPSPAIQEGFAMGLKVSWQKLSVFPGLLIIDPTTPAYSDMSRKDSSKVNWPAAAGETILATRPIFVADTLRANSDLYSTPARMESAAKRLPAGLMALWTPKGELVYVDAHAFPDLVTPIFRSAVDVGVAQKGEKEGLITPQEIKIDGREIRGSTPYLYLDRTRFVQSPLTDAEATLNKRRFDQNTDPAVREEIADTIFSRGRQETVRIPLAHSRAFDPATLTKHVGNFLDASSYEPIILLPTK
jgi:hypothetical protein